MRTRFTVHATSGATPKLIAAAAAIGLIGSLAVSSASAAPAPSATPASPTVQQISSDSLPSYKPVSGEYVQHHSEVETDTFSWGSTIVSSFQVGRNYPTYGAQAIGYSTSTDSGTTWTQGILPGVTASSPQPNSTYPLAVNQSVAYSAKFKQWLIPSVTYTKSPGGTTVPLKETALLVNTSSDGLSWNKATQAVATNVDKAWSTCDNVATSPQYGRCYVAYSQVDSSNHIVVISSNDGGSTWTNPVRVPGPSAATVNGYNTNLVAQRNGHVVLVFTDLGNGKNGSKLLSSVSTNGGTSWSRAAAFQTIQYHTPSGGIRGLNKPSVDVDGAGRVWVAWSDCRFRTSCASNDILFASTTNGVRWTAAKRVAIDSTSSSVDRFIPGFAVEPGTSGSTAHLAVVYYSYPNASCNVSSCRLDVQFATSYDAGSSWSHAATINPKPMPLSWLVKSNKGPMVGDYESVSFVGGRAVTVASVATSAPTGSGAGATYHESEYALTLPAKWQQSAIYARRAPQTVTYAQRSTVSGVVRISGIATAGLKVQLQDRPAGSSSWTYNRAVTSDQNGAVSATVKPPVTTAFRWYLPRSSKSVRTYSNVATVAVRSKISAHVSHRTVQHGTALVVRGYAHPHIQRGVVLLQRLVSGKWHTLRHTTLVSGSSYRMSYTVPKGKSQVRVLLKAAPGLLSSTSPVLPITGR